VVTVPRRAIMSSSQGSFAWVVGNGEVAEMRPVRIARTVGDVAVIAEGLAGGERVISEGVLKVRPGATVAVVEPDTKRATTSVAEETPGAGAGSGESGR